MIHGNVPNPIHILQRDRPRGGDTIDDINEKHPHTTQHVDVDAEFAEIEVPRWEDLVAAAVGEDALGDYVACCHEDDGGADHGGEDGGGAEED
jgi:hypothetical protein